MKHLAIMGLFLISGFCFADDAQKLNDEAELTPAWRIEHELEREGLLEKQKEAELLEVFLGIDFTLRENFVLDNSARRRPNARNGSGRSGGPAARPNRGGGNRDVYRRGSGPNRGTVNRGPGPNRGMVNRGPGPNRGTVNRGPGPNRGTVNRGPNRGGNVVHRGPNRGSDRGHYNSGRHNVNRGSYNRHRPHHRGDRHYRRGVHRYWVGGFYYTYDPFFSPYGYYYSYAPYYGYYVCYATDHFGVSFSSVGPYPSSTQQYALNVCWSNSGGCYISGCRRY